VLPCEKACGPLHGIVIQWLPDLPVTAPVECRRGFSGHDPVEIAAFDCGEPGVEGFGDFACSEDSDGPSPEMEVQGVAQSLRMPPCCEIEVHDLGECMDAGISPACCPDSRTAGIQFRNGVFQGLLNASLVLLGLPPDEGSTVIFDFECVPGHALR